MLSSTDAAKLRSNIERVLHNIGNTNGTRLPATKSNSGEAALQWWKWSHIDNVVSGMLKKAKADALKAGIIFDPASEPLPPGPPKQIYDGDAVKAFVQVNNPSQVLNKNTLRSNLLKAGVKEDVVNKAFEAATTTAQAPHKFFAILAEKD